MSTVKLHRTTVMVGQDAVRRRARETGETSVGAASELASAAGLEALVLRARVLLGSLFDDLAASHRRGRSAPSTPPKDPHRLMQVVERVELSAATFGGPRPTLDTVAVELHATLSLLERWTNDPSWPDILRALRDPGNYCHNVLTLAAASFLSDVGNGVGLHVPDATGKRAPDIHVAIGPRDRFAIEVKAPRRLQESHWPLHRSDRREVVRDALKKAGTGATGQLSANCPGMLIVGGFHLSGRDVTLLAQTAREELEERGAKRPHLAGIGIVSLGVRVEVATARIGWSLTEPGAPSLYGELSVETAMNPAYTGPIEVSTGRRVAA